MALYRSPLTVTLWPSSFLKKYGPMIPPAHKAHQTIMSSGYYMELDETPKTRYDEKLSCNGNKLPDPFDQSTMEHVFVYNKKLWPPITFGDIYMYLVEKEYTYTREKMRNHKSLDAFSYVLSGKCSFGLGEVCSHVAALLFAVEMANNKESPAPTSVACMWNKTSKKEHNPDAPYLEDLTDEEETSSASETEHQEENHLPNSCFARNFKKLICIYYMF
ncbi:hypothetical protein TNCV_644341 [Trichonephila clavipes]|nr:hypothetical protein TNCV_644341 [Trichonephila clavipes]